MADLFSPQKRNQKESMRALLLVLVLLSLAFVLAGKNYYDILGIDRSASKVYMAFCGLNASSNDKN
jgi:hypothetical protein